MTCDLSEEFVKEVLEDDVRLKEQSKQISHELLQQKYDISYFLEKLGFALTSPNTETRARGMKLFSSTLSNLPIGHLDETQLNFIVNFYCDRLKDHHSVLPSILDGMQAIVKMGIPKGSIEKLFRNLFQHVSCQSQIREDRRKMFDIISYATDYHFAEVSTMGADFVYGVMSAIDGERDPRNLDFLFTFMPKFMRQFPLFHLAEDMFETFACYFPIDFQPLKEENAITRDELADKLADCLVASDSFVEWTINLVLEKLESDLKVAKLDSLNLLIKSAKNFPPNELASHLEGVWKVLKLIIFSGSDDPEIISTGLNSLKEILQNISRNADSSKHIQTIILGTILPHLSDAHHKLFKAAASIATVCVDGDAVFAASKLIHCFILKIEEDGSDLDQTVQMLNIVGQILKICEEKKVLKEVDQELRDKLEEILMKFLSANDINPDIVNVVFTCLLQMFEVLSPQHKSALFKYLVQAQTSVQSNIQLKIVIAHLSNICPEELNMEFIEPILENFVKYSPEVKYKILQNFTTLIIPNYFRNTILDLFCKCIYESATDNTPEMTVEILKQYLEENPNESVLSTLYSDFEFLDRIIKFTRQSSLSFPELDNVFTILRLLVQSRDPVEQKKIIDKYFPILNLEVLNDLCIAKAIIGYSHSDVDLEQHLEKLFDQLVELSLRSECEKMTKLYNHLLCSLVNKTNYDFENILRKSGCANSKNSVRVSAWICKGLLARGYPQIEYILVDIVKLLDHETLSMEAVKALEIISEDHNDVYLPVVKPLSKQKLFVLVIKALKGKLHDFSQPHIHAFSNVLQNTPSQILKLNVEEISPILFKCIESENTVLIEIALRILNNFLLAKDDYFQNHLSHLIPQFLKLTKLQSSMKIRILALQCLQALTSYPIYLLHPHKVDVTLGLMAALDDKKRLVRKEAVNVRNFWFLLES